MQSKTDGPSLPTGCPESRKEADPVEVVIYEDYGEGGSTACYGNTGQGCLPQIQVREGLPEDRLTETSRQVMTHASIGLRRPNL